MALKQTKKNQKRGNRLFSGAPCKKEKKSDRLGQNAQRLMDSKRMSEICSTCNRNPGRVK